MSVLIRLWPLIALLPAAALAATFLDRIQIGPWHRFRLFLYRRHLQARLARGSDRYFEELRALKAYPPEGPRPLQPLWRSFLFNLAWVAAVASLTVVNLHLVRE